MYQGPTAGRAAPYGRISVRVKGRKSPVGRAVHRLIWAERHGPIPPDFEVDHRCRVTLCCQASHLEAVHRDVNLSRRTGYKPVSREEAASLDAVY